jgi:hypothetical protein
MRWSLQRLRTINFCRVKAMKPRESSKAMSDLATRFVNLKNRNSVRSFVMEHANDIRVFTLVGEPPPTAEQQFENTVSVLVDVIQHLRSGWTGKTDGGLLDIEKAARNILFGVRAVPMSSRITYVDHSTPEREDVWASPAVEPVPYRKSRKQVNFFFRFKRRDVLDEIAYAVLVAKGRELLRVCKGYRTHPEWNCQMRYLVANELRTEYCYGGCGERNQAEAAREWQRKRGKAKRVMLRDRRKGSKR